MNETTTGTTGTGTTRTLEQSVLVFEHPGTLDPLKNRDRDKVLDSFNLYSEKASLLLKSVPTIHLENGWFRQKMYNLSFKVDDLVNTDNYVLALDAAQTQGRLIVMLNGNEIYNAELTPGNVEPIKIDKDSIKSQNSLVFTVSGVGLAFWSLNQYDLQNVRMIADFLDVSKRQYKNFFILSSTEKENVESTELHFVPDCLTKTVGPLTIAINDRPLHYDVVPDCGGLISKVPFDPSILKQGDNSVTFSAADGNFFIDRVSIKLTLKQLDYPFYYFELKQDDINRINNNTANVTLDLRFADLESKTGELNVDGHLSAIETDNATFKKSINVFVETGQNYVQIVPKTKPLNIVDLKVSLAK